MNGKIPYPVIRDHRGALIPLQEGKPIPFAIQQVSFLTDLQRIRGGACKTIRQLIMCVQGSCEMNLEDGENKETLRLQDDGLAVLVESKNWYEVSKFSPDCLIAVFASGEEGADECLRTRQEYLDFIASAEKV